MTKQEIIKAIKLAEERLSNERDNIRDLITRLEELYDDAELAADEMHSAADTLSRTL